MRKNNIKIICILLVLFMLLPRNSEGFIFASSAYADEEIFESSSGEEMNEKIVPDSPEGVDLTESWDEKPTAPEDTMSADNGEIVSVSSEETLTASSGETLSAALEETESSSLGIPVPAVSESSVSEEVEGIISDSSDNMILAQDGEKTESLSEEIPDEEEPAENEPVEDEQPTDTSAEAGTEGDSAPEMEYPAFYQLGTVDDVTVEVSAEAGVFPEGAALSAIMVPNELVAAAIEKEREDDVKVVTSYTFDIKVVDAEGNVLQPAEGKTVQASFTLAEAADENLDAQVYHISDDGIAGELETEVNTDEQTVTAETNSFSYYTIEFTYKTLHYELSGGQSVALTDILDAAGLVGVCTEAVSSNPEMFTVEMAEGVWTVSALKEFSETETLTVTINGRTYEIQVTYKASGEEVENALNNTARENDSKDAPASNVAAQNAEKDAGKVKKAGLSKGPLSDSNPVRGGETEGEDSDEMSIPLSDGEVGPGELDNDWGGKLMNLVETKENAQKAVDQGLIDTSVTVAVIDTGINTSHTLFAGRISPASKSFINENPADYNDENGHGTHIAGIIAANTPSNVQIMALQVLDSEKKGTVDDLISAIFYASENGADIINLSLSLDRDVFNGNEQVYNDAIIRLAEAINSTSAVVVVSAGNGGTNIEESGTYPAGFDKVITVSAVGGNGGRYAFSNYGVAVDYCAPGEDIYSAWVGGVQSYQYLSGTSMAVPFISAAFALKMMDGSEFSQDELRNMGDVAYFGAGLPVVNINYNHIPERPVIENIATSYDSISFTWENIDGLNYNVYRRIADSGEAFERIDKVCDGNFEDVNVIKKQTYEYYIEADEPGYYKEDFSESVIARALTIATDFNLKVIVNGEEYTTADTIWGEQRSAKVHIGDIVQVSPVIVPEIVDTEDITWTVIHRHPGETTSANDIYDNAVFQNGYLQINHIGWIIISATIPKDYKSSSCPMNRSFAFTVLDDSIGENLFWEVYSDEDNQTVLHIFGTGEMYKTLKQPADYPWYDEWSSIQKLIIDNGVTSVGQCAFASMENLTIIEGMQEIKTIENSAFSSCKKLKSIPALPNLESIGNSAFVNCSSLKDIWFSDTVNNIGDSAFKSCTGLKTINIPASTDLRCVSSAFQGCDFETVYLPSTDFLKNNSRDYFEFLSTKAFVVDNDNPDYIVADLFN